MRPRNAQTLLLTACGLFLVAGGLFALSGCGSGGFLARALDSINPFTPAAPPDAATIRSDPTGLIGTFGHLATICLGLSAIVLVVGLVLRDLKVILGAACGVAVGISFGLLKGIVAEHPIWLYSALGVAICAIVYLNFHAGRKAVAKVQSIKQGKSHAHQVRDSGGGGPDPVVRAAQAGSETDFTG